MKAFTHDIPGTPAAAWDPLIAGLPALAPVHRVVVLAAHPDDETLGAGGLLALAGSATVVIASDGAGSHPDSPTHPPAALARLRRVEAERACAVLGADVRFLDLPDGRLAQHVDALADALDAVVGPGDVIVSTWLGDGHPDHEACARAARRVAAQAGCRLLEVPIWAWHWADPSGTDVPQGMRRLELPPAAAAAKAAALACYPSQTTALSDRPGDEAVLPPEFLAHFARSVEVFVDPLAAPGADPSWFDAQYAADSDPWQLGTRWYEQRKRSLVLASLPRPRFRRAFEPGCGPGLLSAELRRRCDELVAADSSPAAVAQARARVPDVRRLTVPTQWPGGTFDLVVLHEVAYYVPDLRALTDRVVGCLDPDGVVVLCHWRHTAPDHPHDAATVHHVVRQRSGLARIASHVEDDFLLDVLAADPRSVARREGVLG